MTRGIRTTQHVFGSGDAADDEIIDYGSNANGHWELYKSGHHQRCPVLQTRLPELSAFIGKLKEFS